MLIVLFILYSTLNFSLSNFLFVNLLKHKHKHFHYFMLDQIIDILEYFFEFPTFITTFYELIKIFVLNLFFIPYQSS